MNMNERSQQIKNSMTVLIALKVKEFRVVKECSYSTTAERIAKLYPQLPVRTHPIGGGYATDGRELCEAAQDFLKEDWKDRIW